MMKRQTILLVEGDYSFALLFLYAFEQEECRCNLRWVTGAEHARKYLHGKGVYANRQTYPKPDLVVLDLKTLKVSGGDDFDFQRKFPGVNGAYLAAIGESSNKEEKACAAGLGAKSFHVKSKDAKEVQDILHNMLGKLLLDGSSN